MSSMAPSFVHYGQTQSLSSRDESNAVEAVTVLLLGGLAGFILCFSVVVLVLLLLSRRDHSNSDDDDDADSELGRRHSHRASSVPANTSNETLPARVASPRSVYSEHHVDDEFVEVDLRGGYTAQAMAIIPVQKEDKLVTPGQHSEVESPYGTSTTIPPPTSTKRPEPVTLRTVEVSSPKASVPPKVKTPKVSRFVEHGYDDEVAASPIHYATLY
ncbi:hypothetical protein F4803DRAFT_546726 [Xylaria telfairii]|nr:hypothetical protein F4803DRAFT_546726 [Xylaria telfairii]